MSHRLLVILSVLSLFFLGGCGAADRPAKSPSRGGRIQQESRATAVRADNDADGIVDQYDREPADEPPPPAEPAPGGGGGAGNLVAAPAAAKPALAQPTTTPEKKTESGATTTDAQTSAAPHDTAMLIYTARITMAVYQVDQGLGAVERIARDMGGYLSVKHDREITIRVPRARFDPTLAAIDKIGDVLHRDIQAQDVTDEYFDLEIRIKNARAMQVRLKQLLEKAAVKEALEIEKEMRRVTEELELLEGKIKLLKDKIAYSTITVVFEARGSSIQSTRIRLPFPWLTELGLPSLLQLQESK